ncbi:MAG: AAA family ATPase [Candidatus Helarchaeota archaeon]
MLEKIELKNYKLFQNLELFISNINLLLGLNNSGKSSVLESIMLMKFLNSYPKNIDTSNLELKEYNNKIINLKESVYKKDTKLDIELKFYSKFGQRNYSKSFINNLLIRKNISSKPLSIDYDFFANLGHSLTGLENTFRQINRDIKKIFYIQFQKDLIQSSYIIPESMVMKEKAILKDAFDILYFIKEKKEYQNMIHYINKILNLYGLNNIRFIPLSGHKYKIVFDNKQLNIEINISEIGSGLAYMVPFIILLNYYPNESLILIESPETHMHPKMQSQFIDVLLNIMELKNHKFIIETHSEHMIYSLLNKIPKKKLSISKLNLYYFKKHKGIANCNKLTITDKGTISGGLPDFFESDINNLIEWISAVSKE